MQNKFKSDFPLLMNDKTVYIDNAATAQKPECVIKALNRFYTTENSNPLRGLYRLSVEATEEYENARKTVQRFIGAKFPEEIIFTRNTTESLNLTAYSYALNNIHSGDEILISIMEHHSNLLPWQMVCRQTGAVLKYIECDSDGRIDLNKVEKLITDKTRIVAITQLSNILGIKYPIKEIAQMAHKKNAIIIVDGAQSTPHLKTDVSESDVDFFAFSSHKIYGPMGIGVLYGKKDILEKMPPFLYGGEMIESVSKESAVYAELPHKFEAGTVNAAAAIGLADALKYVDNIGFETIHKYELDVTSYALEKLRTMEHIHILGSEKPEEHNGIITFTVDTVHPHDVSEILASDNIAVRAGHHCAQPLLEHLGHRSTVRASFAFYNDKNDADKFIESLSTVRERMGYGK